MTITQEWLESEIAKLTKERDRFLTEANQQIATFNGALQTLEIMIQRLNTADVDMVDKDKNDR